MKSIESLIIDLRNQKVILDSDVAKIYGVETRDINKAVKNNSDKFPRSYIFELKPIEKQEVVENFHHLKKLKFSPNLPKAFTEKGLYMLKQLAKYCYKDIFLNYYRGRFLEKIQCFRGQN